MPEKRKISFRKVFRALMVLAVVAGVLILSVSAIGNNERGKLSDIKISIVGSQSKLFVTNSDIMSLLKKASGNSLKNQPMSSLNLSLLEKRLLEDGWIKKAELFIDNSNTLHVNVEENSPVARIFTAGGNSFYVSSTFGVLPLSDRLSVRLPVFTDYPGAMTNLKASDSALLQQIGTLANYIHGNDFWMSQISQIDIAPNGEFTLIPMLGNQVINFGTSDDYQEKFNKLLAFYQQVQTRVGWNKYSVIDLQFKGQVVAEKRDAGQIKTDSLASIRIMKNLIDQAKNAINDSTRIQLPPSEVNEYVPATNQSDTHSEKIYSDEKPVSPGNSVNPQILKTPAGVAPKPISPKENKVVQTKERKIEKRVERKAEKKIDRKKEAEVKSKEKRVPKAVMPSKNDNNDEQY